MNSKQPRLLGPLQILVMNITARSSPSGMDVHRALAKKGIHRSPGAIYITLERLRSSRLVSRRFRTNDHSRGGRSGYVYTVTDKGFQSLKFTAKFLPHMNQRVPH